MTEAITLDAGTGSSGPPSASFLEPGNSTLIMGVVNIEDYQQRDYDSGEPLTWPDGKPKLGKLVTGICVSANNIKAGPESDTAAPMAQPGDLLSVWCEGGKFIAYREARAAGAINVGHVMKWDRLEDAAPKKAGYRPGRVYKAAHRAPEAKDGDLADRCVAAYHELKDRPTLDAPTAGASTFEDEEPF